jgi:lactoylglutathione lyase
MSSRDSLARTGDVLCPIASPRYGGRTALRPAEHEGADAPGVDERDRVTAGKPLDRRAVGRQNTFVTKGSMMRVEHVGVWAADLERLREFYAAYLGATAGAKYSNPVKGFESYFLTLPGGGARLELMRTSGLAGATGDRRVGLAHVAIALGSEAAVDALTARLRTDGYEVVDGPRRTGDGYYESVVLDPEGNRLELTV